MTFIPTIEKIPLDRLLADVVKVSSRSQEVVNSAAELIKNKSADCTNSKELQNALLAHQNSVHAKLDVSNEIAEADWLEWDAVRMALDLIEKTCSNALHEFI